MKLRSQHTTFQNQRLFIDKYFRIHLLMAKLIPVVRPFSGKISAAYVNTGPSQPPVKNAKKIKIKLALAIPIGLELDSPFKGKLA
jgi:hypothetical protein